MVQLHDIKALDCAAYQSQMFQLLQAVQGCCMAGRATMRHGFNDQALQR